MRFRIHVFGAKKLHNLRWLLHRNIVLEMQIEANQK